MISSFNHPELVEGSVLTCRRKRPWPGGRRLPAKLILPLRFASLRMTTLAGSAFALTACSSAATPDKMAQIKPAMKAMQVEAILGRPVRIEQSETTGLSGEIDYYPAHNGEGRVIYLNNVVFKAEFVPGTKS